MKRLLLALVLCFPWSLGPLIALPGCESKKPPAAASTDKPPTVDLSDMTTKELQAYADDLQRKLDAANKQVELNRIAHIKKVLDYVSGVFGILALACVALAIWTSYKKQGVVGAVACAGLATVMLFLVTLAPWFHLIGGVILLGFLVVAAMVIKGLVKKDKMVTSLVTGAQDAITGLEAPAAAKLKTYLAMAQDKLDVRDELRNVRGRLGL